MKSVGPAVEIVLRFFHFRSELSDRGHDGVIATWLGLGHLPGLSLVDHKKPIDTSSEDEVMV